MKYGQKTQNHVKYLVHFVFKGFHHSPSWFSLQLPRLGFTDKFFHFIFCLVNSFIDLFHCCRISNCISNSNSKTILQQPVIHQPLGITKEFGGCIWTNLFPAEQNNSTLQKSTLFLSDHTFGQLYVCIKVNAYSLIPPKFQVWIQQELLIHTIAPKEGKTCKVIK